MKNKASLLLISLFLLISVSTKVNAHCEIPCGIYDDSVRVALIKEHIQTIEKSMTMIKKIKSAEVVDYNQLVRWVNNKEEHANKIQEIVSQYFMHQRIKPTDPKNAVAYAKYVKELTLLHQLQVYAMKAKQTTDFAYLGKMLDATEAFENSYFGHDHDHKHKNDIDHKHDHKTKQDHDHDHGH